MTREDFFSCCDGITKQKNKKKQNNGRGNDESRRGERLALYLFQLVWVVCGACRVSLSLSRVCVFYLFILFIYKEIEEEEKGAVVMAAIDPAPLTFSCCFFRGKLKMTLEKKKKFLLLLSS